MTDDFERAVRTMLSDRADAVTGTDQLPARTAKRGRIRRAGRAATAGVMALAIGFGSWAAVGSLTGDGGRDVQIVTPPQPSQTTDPTPTASPTPTAAPTTAAPQPAMKRVLRNGGMRGGIRAFGSLWFFDSQVPQVPSKVFRVTDEGTVTTTIHLERYVAGAHVRLDPVIDDGGIWFVIENIAATERTRAVGRCRSITRTGNAGSEPAALLRLDGSTNCPTHLIGAIPADTGSGGGGMPAPPVPYGLAYAGGSVWLSTPAGLQRVEPKSGTMTAVDVGSPHTIAAGFGSLWAAVPDADDQGYLLRIDPSNGRVIATIRPKLYIVGFAFGHGSVWAATTATERPQQGAVPFDPNGVVLRIDPASNRVAGEIPGVGGNDDWTTLSIDGRYLYARHGVAIDRIDMSGDEPKRRLRFRVNGRYSPVLSAAVHDGVLWAGVRDDGLYRIETARARWETV